MKKFRTTYACKVTKICGSDLDKYISLAGLEKLKPLMPTAIDFGQNSDLIGVVLNAAVGNYANKNHDAVTNSTAVDIAPNFIFKYVNLNHDRTQCVGAICNYGFSKFGTNTLITAEEARESKDPINLSLAVVLWKPTLSDDFIQLIESSADESSDTYGDVSASWELYFDDYDIAIGKSKDLSECSIVTGAEKDKYEKYLKLNNGNGKYEDNLLFAVLTNGTQNIIPAGIGLVSKPAAEVKGLALAEETQQENADKNLLESTAQTVTEQGNLEEQSKILEKPQTDKQKSVSTIISNMKYSFLAKISEASIQESLAGEIDQLVASKLKEADVQYTEALKTETEKTAQASASLKSVSEENDKLQKEFADLKAKVEAKEKADAYNARMASFEEKYTLSADHKKILAARLKDLSEDGFVALEAEMNILLASVDKEKTKQSVASEKEIPLKEVVRESDKTPVTIPNSQSSDVIDFKKLAAKAFNKESITINL